MEASEPHRPEARIEAIVAAGRATRRRPSRAMWLAAAIVGALGALGFALLFFAGEPDDRQPPAGRAAAPPRAAASRTGCAGGLGLGIGIGIAIGFALGRRGPVDTEKIALGTRAQRDHSSRRSP